MSSSALQGLFYLAVAFIVYFLPSVVAEKRKHSSTGGIVILNLLLGWTLLGWIIALVWACSGEHQKQPAELAAVKGPTKRCPFCAEEVHRDAKVCKHCDRDLPVAKAGEIMCECGTANPAAHWRCKSCGASLSGT